MKSKAITDGGLLYRLIGVSPSRLCPDYPHCLRRCSQFVFGRMPRIAIRSDCGWIEVSLCRYTVFAAREQPFFITLVVLARITAFKKEGMKRRGCHRLGVPVMWLGYIGTYPLCIYAVCRYLAHCPFSKYIDYYQPIQRHLTENAFG